MKMREERVVDGLGHSFRVVTVGHFGGVKKDVIEINTMYKCLKTNTK